MTTQRAGGAIVFDDAEAYDRFMARWSRIAGARFLGWLAPSDHAAWLELGCGTGAFTELILDRCAPRHVAAIDPSAEQIEYCRRAAIGARAELRVAAAHALPFPDRSFDLVAGALVFNFLADPTRALAEVRRVVRRGGAIAGYVWDFATGRAPNSSVALGLRRLGVPVPPMPGAEIARLDSLEAIFKLADLVDIGTCSFDVNLAFPNFHEFWRTQIPSFSPLRRIVDDLSVADRLRLIELVRERLEFGPDGTACCTARVNAIKARAP